MTEDLAGESDPRLEIVTCCAALASPRFTPPSDRVVAEIVGAAGEEVDDWAASTALGCSPAMPSEEAK